MRKIIFISFFLVFGTAASTSCNEGEVVINGVCVLNDISDISNKITRVVNDSIKYY